MKPAVLVLLLACSLFITIAIAAAIVVFVSYYYHPSPAPAPLIMETEQTVVSPSVTVSPPGDNSGGGGSSGGGNSGGGGSSGGGNSGGSGSSGGGNSGGSGSGDGGNGGSSGGSGKKPMIFLNLSGHGDAKNGRMQDAVDMANGKGWEFVAANVDGWNINPANTHDPWKILSKTKKRPTWILHENEVSASLIGAGNTYIDHYQKWIDDTGIPNKVYGRFIMRDRDPSGRRYEPGVMAKWKNAAPFAAITTTVFASGRGTEFTESCSEALCEQNWSALREGDGFVYEQVPGFLNANHGSKPGEWPGHRGAWKKMFYVSKQLGGKKILWLMATDGAGSLARAQESFNWMKSQNLVPDVIIVANYGEDPAHPDITAARNAYRSIPEGSGNEFPDTVTGIARWLLMNR